MVGILQTLFCKDFPNETDRTQGNNERVEAAAGGTVNKICLLE